MQTNHEGFHVVTGAFGYSGRYIAKRLLAKGWEVRSLTNTQPHTDPFDGAVSASPLCFDDPDRLTESLRGARVLYNTYWVRFNHVGFAHHTAVANTKALFAAAKRAGVERVVHVSITNPNADSDLEYFAGKGELEAALINSGLSYAILRPTVLFGKEDILINNIAWMLRHFPLFGVFGDGGYRLQPIYVDDLAALAAQQGQETENCIVNAIGPETFTYRDLVTTVGRTIHKERPIFNLPPTVGWLIGWCIGKLKGDVTITRPEIVGLMRDLLYVDAPAAGTTALSSWAKDNADTLGVTYANELARRSNAPT